MTILTLFEATSLIHERTLHQLQRLKAGARWQLIFDNFHALFQLAATKALDAVVDLVDPEVRLSPSAIVGASCIPVGDFSLTPEAETAVLSLALLWRCGIVMREERS